MSLAGRFVSFVVGAAVDVFYRRRLLVGSVPAAGPVLLIANHPNGLMDPVVVQNAAGRRVRMLAKAPLFTMPGVSLLVRALDCLPVYRAKDGADTGQNAGTFRAVEQALVDGDCVLIFPEGISHDEPQLQPLKTGAARMVLGALRSGAADVVVVPIGLTYADKLRYRSTAVVEIGAPIVVREHAPPNAATDDVVRDAARKLTEVMQNALHDLTLNVERWEDLALLDAVDAIWRQDDPERTRRVKKLADGVRRLRDLDPVGLDAARARLSDWVDDVTRLGLTPRDVVRPDATLASGRVVVEVVRQVIAAVVGLPLAAFGACFWAVPFWAVELVWRLKKPERDVGATVKILASLVFFPLWFAAAGVAAGYVCSTSTAAALLVIAPGAGLTTRHYVRRREVALRAVLTGVGALRRRSSLTQLRAERERLCAMFDRLAKSLDDGSAADDAGT